MYKIHTIRLGNKEYPLGYRVVTDDLKSLGLRNNPNIIQYPFNQWYLLSENMVEGGDNDWGGIWVARTLSGAKGLKKYMAHKYRRETRIFLAALDQILFFNSYRIKTNGIKMFEEYIP